MAVLEKLTRTARTLLTTHTSKTLTSLPGRPCVIHRRLLHGRKQEGSSVCNAFKVQSSRLQTEARKPIAWISAFLAGIGLVGVNVPKVGHTDADKGDAKPSLPSESPSRPVDLEGIAKKQQQQIDDLLRSKGMKSGSHPVVGVSVINGKVRTCFYIPPACEASHLIANLVSHLGLKVEGSSSVLEMPLFSWDSAAGWNLGLKHPGRRKDIQADHEQSTDKTLDAEVLRIVIFHSYKKSDKAEVHFIKQGMLSSEELDALVSVLEIAGRKFRKNKTTEETADEDITIPSLEFMGIQIYGVDEPSMTTSQSNNKISWDNIAGYDHQKRQIEDTILLALRHPEVYDGIAHKTRSKFESNTPRALLFEGPPGTGKTSCARVIANQAGVPLLYVPLEIIISKWFGESERSLRRIFSVANDFPNGAIIFLDEIDALAGARDSGTHEFSRRILSVLLQQIDGFEQKKKVILIAATNRKQDLDPALISRFNSSIIFGLPDHDARMGIIAKYAKHLTRSDIDEFAEITKGMSGRDIRDICEQAERTWASKVIRGQASIHGKEDDPPNLEEYVESVHDRRKALLNIEHEESKF